MRNSLLVWLRLSGPFMFVIATLTTSSLAMARDGGANDTEKADKELARKECGACHYYLSKEFLPGFSWKIILDNLENHFGEDASLDEETRKRILAYMVGSRSMEIPLRVTETGWWKNAHGSSWKSMAEEGSINVSNCANCHRPDN